MSQEGKASFSPLIKYGEILHLWRLLVEKLRLFASVLLVASTTPTGSFIQICSQMVASKLMVLVLFFSSVLGLKGLSSTNVI